MKAKNLNLTLEWDTIRNIPSFVKINAEFPSYNIKVYSENEIIYEINELRNYIPIYEIEYKIINNSKKPKLISGYSKNKVSSQYIFNFEHNYSHFAKKYKKIGFYKNLNFQVDYNNDGKGDFEIEASYEEVENLNKDLLFSKIYRSSDYLNIKLLINKEYLIEKEIHSFLIFSTALNKYIGEQQLNNLFTENIKEKWLDVNEKTALLTIPFIESDIVETTEDLKIKIVPLNKLQSDMYLFFKDKYFQDEIMNFYLEFFPQQIFNIGKIHKQFINNETVLFYQNYLYLFNNQSFESNVYRNEQNINNIVFKDYYPSLNKDRDNKTINLKSRVNTETIDNNYNLEDAILGYYQPDLLSYTDIKIDLNYLESSNIAKTSIINIEEVNGICSLYIEFITSFHNNEKFYIENSSNLKFERKYKSYINAQDDGYITFLFKYSYPISDVNSLLTDNQLKSQVILDKDLINFSAKIIL